MKRTAILAALLVAASVGATPATKPATTRPVARTAATVEIVRLVATDDAPRWIKSWAGGFPNARIERIRDLYRTVQHANREIADAQKDTQAAAKRTIKQRVVLRDARQGDVTVADEADRADRSRDVRDAKNRAAAAGRARAESLWEMRGVQIAGIALHLDPLKTELLSFGTIDGGRLSRVLGDDRMIVRYKDSDLIVTGVATAGLKENATLDFHGQCFRIHRTESFTSVMDLRRDLYVAEAVEYRRFVKEVRSTVEAIELDRELRDLFGEPVPIPPKPPRS